jgi:hypothetical protein
LIIDTGCRAWKFTNDSRWRASIGLTPLARWPTSSMVTSIMPDRQRDGGRKWQFQSEQVRPASDRIRAGERRWSGRRFCASASIAINTH